MNTAMIMIQACATTNVDKGDNVEVKSLRRYCGIRMII